MYDFRWFLVGKLRNLSRERLNTASGINPVMHFLEHGKTLKKRYIVPNKLPINLEMHSMLPCTAFLEVLHSG